MAPKSLALLIAGIIIISGLFTVFHVAYPSGNPIIPKIPQNVPNVTLFREQFPDKNLLGFGNTYFNPSGNQTITIEGYAKNASSNLPIANSVLYSAVSPVETSTYTNSTGFYSIVILHSGVGNFAFKISGYQTDYVKLSLYGVTSYWQNLSFKPSAKYLVDGYTETQNGTTVSNVQLQLTGFFADYNTVSDSNGFFSLNLPNDTYRILALKQGFQKTTNPSSINVAGKAITDYKIHLIPSQKPEFNVSGYIFNELDTKISGAVIVSYPELNSTASNSSGYYSVPVVYGQNVIYAVAQGYAMNSSGPLYVVTNLTDVNITLSSQSPFNVSGTSSGQGLGGLGSSGSGSSGGSAAGNLSKYLSNNTSKITYGNSSSTNSYLLSGYVTDTNNSGPVYDTYLRFYVNVNGTYFYENVTTNATGHYQFLVSYPGYYNIAVYSSLYKLATFGVWINQTVEKHNFTLTPYSKYVFKVTGYVLNGIDNQLISNSKVVAGVPQSSVLVNYSIATAGSYSLFLVEGNYSLTGSAAGYNPNTMQIDLTRNMSVNISLNPSNSIGSNVKQWNNSSGTGVPGINGTSVSSNLTSGNGGNGSAIGAQSIILTVHLENANNSASITNTPFVMFIMIDGQSYKWNNTTNANGNSILTLFYTGNYTFLVTSLLYESNPVSMEVNGNSTITFKMNPREAYTVTMTLKNAYGLYNGSSLYVPENYLNVTNYTLLIEPLSVSSSPSGTIFTYDLPNASYAFSYSNPNFVGNQTFVDVTGNSVNRAMSVSPYLIVIHDNTDISWSYTISNLVTSPVQVSASTGYLQTVNASAGTFQFNGFISGYGSSVAAVSVNLKTTSSVANVYFDVSENSVNTQFSNIYPNSADASKVTTNFTYSANSDFYVYELDTNSTIYNISSITINSKSYQFTTLNGYMANLTSYFHYTGSGMDIELVSTFPNNSPQLILYYYQVSVNSNSFSVGGA